MTWIVRALGGLKFYALAALAGAGALLMAVLRARRDGANAERLKQATARDKLQEHYDEIERESVDPVRSYDRLRGMSDGEGGR